MILQSNRITPVPGPSEDVVERVLEKLVSFSLKSDVPKGLEVGKDEAVVSYKELYQLIHDMNGKGGSGLPMNMKYPNKSDLRSNCAASEVIEVTVDMMRNMLGYTFEEMEKMSPAELVSRGLAHPIKLHVKEELHSKAKLDEGRYRLIMGVGCCEELIDRLLFGNQNKVDVGNCYSDCGTAAGADLNTDEGVLRFWNAMMKPDGRKLFSSDVKGWDWSVLRWLYDIELEARRRLNGASKSSVWYDLARKRYLILCRSVFVTSNGNMYALTVDGIVKSGCYNTTYSNSRCRDGLSILTHSGLSKSMGDDNVSAIPYTDHQFTRDETILEYKKWGFRLTDYREVIDSFEFCSYLFEDGIAIPLNHVKGLLNLMNEEPDEELYEQFIRVHRHSPHLDDIREFLKQTSWSQFQ